MSKIISIIGLVLIIIVISIGAGLGKDVSKAFFNSQKQSSQYENNSSQDEVNKSNIPASLDKMQSTLAAQISNKNSKSEKLYTASKQFSGFYYVNSVTREKYCARLGIDITSFTNKFKLLNADEYQISTAILSIRNESPESIGARLDSSYSSQMNQAMQDMANINKVSTTDLCASFEQNAIFFADTYSFKKMLPATYSALHDYLK